MEVFPYKIHTVLTDNGMAFADLPKNRSGPSRRFLGPHIFDRVCVKNGIEHRLTKPYHPWTNGQAERMHRTIKDATVKVFHYDDLHSLKTHVLAFVTAYNLAKHLKALRWRTPYQVICEAWTKDPTNLQNRPAPPHSGTAHLAHFRPTRMFVPTLLAVTCGLRRGEIAALKWRGVDLASEQISISESVEQTSKGVRTKEIKSGRSRTVALPLIVVDELRRHRLRQAEATKIGRPH